MLVGMAYDTDNFTRPPGPQIGDEIIFRPRTGIYPGIRSYSYGTVTGRGSHDALGVAYVVTPAQLYDFQEPNNYALLLLSRDLILKPEFEVGECIPLPRPAAPEQPPYMILEIEDRKVELKADGQLVYRYSFSIEVINKQGNGLEEEDLKKIVDAGIPNQV